jgi:hypothetical protein
MLNAFVVSLPWLPQPLHRGDLPLPQSQRLSLALAALQWLLPDLDDLPVPVCLAPRLGGRGLLLRLTVAAAAHQQWPSPGPARSVPLLQPSFRPFLLSALRRDSEG